MHMFWSVFDAQSYVRGERALYQEVCTRHSPRIIRRVPLHESKATTEAHRSVMKGISRKQEEASLSKLLRGRLERFRMRP